MTSSVGTLRPQVVARAGNCCEYCLISQTDRLFSFHVEHIVAEKHRGETKLENLCLSCPQCNNFKGSDLTSIDPETDLITPLFNPRKQKWSEHFRLNGPIIEPLTSEGRVTVWTLRLNESQRVIERETLIEAGTYPCAALLSNE